MPCWYFTREELEKTPSVKAGVDSETEAKYQREGTKLIIDSGTALGLRYDVCATGVVYFHRFYMFHTFTDFHRYVTGASCLLLAAKMDESSVSCDAIIKSVETLLTATQFSVFGSSPKEEVLITEKILLETLKFDLLVEHPYSHLLRYIKLLQGDQETVEQLLKMSWTFVNDSLCTTLCLEWEADLIALSLLYLSCRLLKFSVTDWVDKPPDFTGKWYQFFLPDITLNIIEDICREVLDLYAGKRSERVLRRSPSPPAAAPVAPVPRQQQDKPLKRVDSLSSLSSLESMPSLPRSRSQDRGRRRLGSRSRSRSTSSSLRRRRHSSPPTTSPSVTKATVSPSPASHGDKQLLSREAFESLQRLMRRQSGLMSPPRHTPSPRQVPPLPFTPVGGPYVMPYPPPSYTMPHPHLAPGIVPVAASAWPALPMDWGSPNVPPPGFVPHMAGVFGAPQVTGHFVHLPLGFNEPPPILPGGYTAPPATRRS